MNTIQKTTAALLTLTLGACASADDLMKVPPVLTLETTASVETVRDTCLGDSKGQIWNMKPYQGGWIVWEQTTQAYANFVVKIAPIPKGAHVEAFVDGNRGSLMGVSTFQDNVRPCLDALPRG